MPKPSVKTTSAIVVDGLSVRFADVTILDDISFTVPAGQITAIIGPNGSGKTTLMKAMLELLPYRGNVRFSGAKLSSVRHRIGYVPQRFDFDRGFPLSVEEFLELARKPITAKTHILHVIHEVGLPATILQARLGDLSGGQLQRVLVAQAIMNNPDILFLDEPSTGIDIQGEAALYDVLTHLKETHHTTIVLVSHDLNMIADVVDHVICVNRQIICTGTPAKTLTNKKLSTLYDGRAQQVQHKHHHN